MKTKVSQRGVGILLAALLGFVLSGERRLDVFNVYVIHCALSEKMG